MVNAVLIPLLALLPPGLADARVDRTAPAAAERVQSADRGDVRWFDGGLDQALARAKRSGKPVMIEFWADWCVWCERHEAENLIDRDVVASLARFECIGANLSQDEAGAFVDPVAEALMKRFAVKRFPTLVFLSADGTPQDLVAGYLPKRALVAEIDRIARNEGTVGAWSERVDRAPNDLEARYQRALKLDALGDAAGFRREIDFIQRADPTGASTPMRRMELRVLTEKLWGCMSDPEVVPDPTELEAFLAKETVPELVCDAQLLLGAVMDELGRPDESMRAYHTAWKHAEGDRIASVGNGIAWNFWTRRDEIDDDERRFALSVSKKATKSFEKTNFDPLARAMFYDTLACCYFMNGNRAQAIKWIDRSIANAPGVQEYVDHLELFRADS